MLSHSSPAAHEKLAGVRDGVAGPRDQPPGSLQVRRPPQDRPQPVERRFLPFRSFSELPQWLWQEVEEALHSPPLVCSSQPLFLVWHARTLSPMSDTLVVYICIALDKHALPRCFSFPLWHIHGCHFFNYFSPGVFSALYWLGFEAFPPVSGWFAPPAKAAAFQLRFPFPPSIRFRHLASLPARPANFKDWNDPFMFCHFNNNKTSPLPSCYKRIVSAFWMSRIIPFLLFEASPNSTYSPQWMPRVLLIYFCLLPAYECPVRSTNLSRSPSVLTIVINKQIILVNICLQMMMMNWFVIEMQNRAEWKTENMDLVEFLRIPRQGWDGLDIAQVSYLTKKGLWAEMSWIRHVLEELPQQQSQSQKIFFLEWSQLKLKSSREV